MTPPLTCLQSIFHVSYLRGIFPDDRFQGVDMKNLEGELCLLNGSSCMRRKPCSHEH
jgi:hypothetical protein